MKKLPAIVLLLWGTVFCQDRKPLPGKIVAEGIGLQGVFVINKNTGAEVKTNADGTFTIAAGSGDVLAAYNTTIEVRDFAISEASFIDDPYIMEVSAKSMQIELDEVVISRPAVTSQSLGLVPKDFKFETAAQRRARRYATAASPSLGIGYAINAISGQLYYLELAAKYANKEMYIEKIDNIYTEEELVTECNIPKEYARGFVFYAVEDAALNAALKLNDNGGAKLRLSELALKYLEILKEE